jgi:hypothetical protein
MNYYAKGGQAHGLQAIAQDLQSKGRNGDTILAHINPQEAQMLKAAGGSGTINPATGLREFGMFGIGGGGGFLGTGINKGASDPISNALSNNPISQGISSGFQGAMGAVDQGLVGLDKTVGKSIPGGWGTLGMAAASFVPGMTPLMMGGLGALTGSGVLRKGGKFNLQGALMGGAMAYGMANLTSGLEAAGGGTGAAGTPTPGLDATAESIAGQIANQTGSAVSAAPGSQAAMLAEQAAGMGTAGAQNVASALTAPTSGVGIGSQLMAGNVGNAMNQIGSNISSAANNAYTSAGNLLNKATTKQTYADLAKGYGENVSAAGRGIANLSGLGEGSSKAAQAAFTGSGASLQNTALPIAMGGMGLSDLQAQQDYLNQQQQANAISDADYNTQMAVIEENRQKAIAAMQANPYKFSYGGSVDDEPGTDNLASYAMGGYAMGGQPRFLSGGGDGLSDDIPAVIGKNQPARLADGEFVVSSDVVSGIGNGSSKAGAKKLYDMMDRVRQQAHGTKKQINKVNANKVLPA